MRRVSGPDGINHEANPRRPPLHEPSSTARTASRYLRVETTDRPYPSARTSQHVRNRVFGRPVLDHLVDRFLPDRDIADGVSITEPVDFREVDEIRILAVVVNFLPPRRFVLPAFRPGAADADDTLSRVPDALVRHVEELRSGGVKEEDFALLDFFPRFLLVGTEAPVPSVERRDPVFDRSGELPEAATTKLVFHR
jgi:hypothetical protein